MPRRVNLPGADELFRSTGSVQRAPEVDSEAVVPMNGPVVATQAHTPTARLSGPRHPSGRQRHDEKITVYVSPALAVVLADLEAKGEQSILVRRLRTR
jgi:hypothetical protein